MTNLNDVTPDEWDSVRAKPQIREFFFMCDNRITRKEISGNEVDAKSMIEVLNKPANFYFKTKEELVSYLSNNVKG